MTLLTGTGLIADDLYLLAHDDVSGRPSLQPRALGLGLAAGLLAELALEGAIRFQGDQIVLLALAPRADELARSVLDVLASERDRLTARDWLMFLASTAANAVPQRLERAGYLMRVASRRPWRRHRWIPVDSDRAFARLVRVRAVIEPGRTATASDVVLTGLAAACGLGPRILQYGPPNARHRLEAAVRRLHPDLRELIAQTQAAVDSALLSHRM